MWVPPEELCYCLTTLGQGTGVLALELEAREPIVAGGSYFAASPKRDRSSKPGLLVPFGQGLPLVWPLSK